MRARLDYVSTRNIGLDGEPTKIKSYLKLGFKRKYANIRYDISGAKAMANDNDNEGIINLRTWPLSSLVEYDCQMFPASRHTFLRHWINQPQTIALAYLENNAIKGYIVFRKCFRGYKIGPLFANSYDIANHLLLNALNHRVDNEQVYIDLPEPNKDAIRLAKNFNGQPIFKTSRMYSKKVPDIDINRIFGITSFELG